MLWPHALSSSKKKAKRVARIRNIEEFPTVEVLTLLYNSSEFLPGYFKAFSKLNYPPESLHINFIDNSSKDSSGELAKQLGEELPFKVRVSRSEKNLGFAGGNNLLLRKILKDTDSPFVFLLNADTAISPTCITQLVDLMRADPELGMAEAKQTPREHPKFYNTQTLETSWCSCGGVLIDCNALRETGLFDERFFLYAEDVDLSWRMWLHGWKCKINPQATYEHFTEDLDPNKDMSVQQYYSLRNCFYMYLKYEPVKELISHWKRFNHAQNVAPDEKTKSIFKLARKDALKKAPLFLLDRILLARFPRPSWIRCNGFDYGERRDLS